MLKRDLYGVLGISREADEAEIRSAYRTLAKKYHPDAGEGSSAEKFRAIRDAYETLTDPVRRREYMRDLTPAVETQEIPIVNYEMRNWSRPAYVRHPGHIDLRRYRFGESARHAEERILQDDDWWSLISFLFG